MMSRRRKQAGFTMIEVMVALLLSAIAVIGMIGLYRVQTRSSSYSRRSTEAVILAGDKMEQLRTHAAPMTGGPETIDATGGDNASGPYTRRWTVNTMAARHEIVVEVDWDDDGTTRTARIVSYRGL